MATTVTGQHPNRSYGDGDGRLHLNGSTIALDETGTTFGAPTIGAANGATVSAVHRVEGVQRITLTLAATPIALADATVGGGVKIYDFPEGRVLILGAVGTLTFTTTTTLTSTLNASKTINWGVGTVVQSNGTLATTEQNILPTTNATSSATIDVANTATNAALAAAVFLDGTTTPVDAYLNVGVAGATDIDGDATVTASGTITITYLPLGDY